jgi:type IV pilus assembly protein PilM
MSESIWKKEIRLTRKPKASMPAKPVPSVRTESVLRKEISFRRKTRDREIDRLAQEAVRALSPSFVPVETATAEVLSALFAEPSSEQHVPPAAPELEPAEVPEPEDPWLAAPELPPAAELEPETDLAVQPPAPAAELPPLSPPPPGGEGIPAPEAAAEPRRPKRSRRAARGHAVKKLVGLKIGSSQIAAARVANNGSVEVQQLVREALAPGIVVGGELRDPKALGEALKAFFARNKLPRKGVRLGIASNRIGVRIFDIVGVTEEKQLANAIHFRAQEVLPIPLDEAVLDFRVLSESTDADGQNVKRVLLVVVHRELVERYVGACEKAGISLAGIDLEAFALLRSLAAPADRGSSALVAVSIGYDRSTFAVSDGRVCEFTRVLEWGGSSLNVALARTFDSTPSEVEAIKRNLSLDSTHVPPGLTVEQTTQAVDAVRRQVQSFARELVASLQFYQHQPGSLGIGEIVLTGGTAHLPGLAGELERLIGVHVRIGDPLDRVTVSKRVGESEQLGSFAVAIGLGIED